jgi:hypothetical protein
MLMKYSNAPRHFAARGRTSITNKNRSGGRYAVGPAPLSGIMRSASGLSDYISLLFASMKRRGR